MCLQMVKTQFYVLTFSIHFETCAEKFPVYPMQGKRKQLFFIEKLSLVEYLQSQLLPKESRTSTGEADSSHPRRKLSMVFVCYRWRNRLKQTWAVQVLFSPPSDSSITPGNKKYGPSLNFALPRNTRNCIGSYKSCPLMAGPERLGGRGHWQCRAESRFFCDSVLNPRYCFCSIARVCVEGV